MTLEPFEYQKRTNIEEHNQIVEKINEIVDAINENGLASDLSERVAQLETHEVAQDNTITQNKEISDNKDAILGMRYDTAMSNIQSLDGRVSQNEIDIAGLKTQVGNVDGEVAALSTKVGGLEVDVQGTVVKANVNDAVVFEVGTEAITKIIPVAAHNVGDNDPNSYTFIIPNDPVDVFGTELANAITGYSWATNHNISEGNSEIVGFVTITYDSSKITTPVTIDNNSLIAMAVPSGLGAALDSWPNLTRMLNDKTGGGSEGGFTPWVEEFSDGQTVFNSDLKIGDIIVYNLSIHAPKVNASNFTLESITDSIKRIRLTTNPSDGAGGVYRIMGFIHQINSTSSDKIFYFSTSTINLFKKSTLEFTENTTTFSTGVLAYATKMLTGIQVYNDTTRPSLFGSFVQRVDVLGGESIIGEPVYYGQTGSETVMSSFNGYILHMS